MSRPLPKEVHVGDDVPWDDSSLWPEHVFEPSANSGRSARDFEYSNSRAQRAGEAAYRRVAESRCREGNPFAPGSFVAIDCATEEFWVFDTYAEAVMFLHGRPLDGGGWVHRVA